MPPTRVLPHTNVNTSSDFSSVFREQVVERKNPQTISGNETGIPFSKIHCVVFFPMIPTKYHRQD
jgi:hypothetical protein